MKLRTALLTTAAVFYFSSAFADGYDLTHKSIDELVVDNGAAATGDYTVRYDASANAFKKIDATIPLGSGATATEINNAADISANTENTTATNVLTTAECGKNFYLNSATEFVTTLPAPTSGCGFKFYVDAAPSGASYTIVTSDNLETIKGIAFDMTGGAVSAGAGTAAADTISFVASTALEADYVELLSNGNTWHAVAFSSASGAITFTSAQ